MQASAVVRAEVRCPRCGRTAIRPARLRTLLDHIGLAVRLRPFRCRNCYTRFFVWAGFHQNIRF
jgi:hypothetical protein